MRKKSIITMILTALILLGCTRAYAMQSWAMMVWKRGAEKPYVIDYHSVAEKAENGLEYNRIYDDGFLFRNEPYNPIKQQYGYRFEDKRLLIYDFENAKEILAFDFTLSTGDKFSTFNGMEWVVENVKDTIVNVSQVFGVKPVSKKLLTVRTLDGKYFDQWLEDFGSFTNHFMIKDLEDVSCSQTLWMEYDYGEYVAREINADPMFAHDSGWMEGHYGRGEEKYDAVGTKCFFESGKIVLEDVKWWCAHREYNCFYRIKDDIYLLNYWELDPQVDNDESVLRKDVVYFYGLPNPEGGEYVVHVGTDAYSTKINIASSPARTKSIYYDLSGRQSTSIPTRNVYVKDGVKYMLK